MSKMFTWMKQSKLSLLLALIVAVGLLVGGCGASDSYTDHTAQVLTKTDTPLIDSVTLKSWIDQGLVNSNDFENVVIFHLGSPTDSVIPGSYLWNSSTELTMTREEALSDITTSIITGNILDEVLQRSGVNKFSTIVLSGTGNWNLERAYFTLRYWGVPKSRIKLLNGGTNAWAATAIDNGWDSVTYGLTNNWPLQTANNNFSVRDYPDFCPELRYSISEMIQIVDDNNASIAAGNGPLVNILQQTTGTPSIANGIGRSAASFMQDESLAGRFYKSADEILAILADSSTYGPGEFVEGIPTITHCVSGMSCTVSYFALDAILGWDDTTIFDGSARQWESYKSRDPLLTDGKDLQVNDAWRTDLYGRSQSTNIRTDLVIDPVLNFNLQTVDDPRANQIESEDFDYKYPAGSGTSGSAPGPVSGGGGGGC